MHYEKKNKKKEAIVMKVFSQFPDNVNKLRVNILMTQQAYANFLKQVVRCMKYIDMESERVKTFYPSELLTQCNEVSPFHVTSPYKP